MNGIFLEEIKKYDLNKPNEVIIKRAAENNRKRVEETYNEQVTIFKEKLNGCLADSNQDFDTQELIRATHNFDYEILVGQYLIRILDTLINRGSTSKIIELKSRINTSLEILEEKVTTLEDLLKKVQLLPRHQEDNIKYQEEIANALQMLE